ncbi:MAG: hypothetical protein AMXMBFR84_34430 [Candidatus Hydrogenedentota bacterium]
MVKAFLIALLAGAGGYILGLVGGSALVMQLSSNTHDRSLEAAMTGAFIFGPVAAIGTFAVAFVILATRRTKRGSP